MSQDGDNQREFDANRNIYALESLTEMIVKPRHCIDLESLCAFVGIQVQ